MAGADTFTLSPKEKRELKNGEIPEILVEELRLVSPQDGAGAEFQRKMELLQERLFPRAKYPTRPNVRYVLTDDKYPNAFYINGASPPIICFSTKLLRMVSSVDELAYVMGHEWTHKILVDQFGEGRNSKGEEYWADVNPLAVLHDAGLDPNAGTTILKKLFRGERGRSPYDPVSILDVHGVPLNRIEAVEKALVALEHERGGWAQTPTADTTFETLARTAVHQTPIDKWLASRNYDQLDTVGKLGLLSEVLTELRPNRNARVSSLSNHIESLRVRTDDPAEAAAFTTLVDQILHFQRANRTYRDSSDYDRAQLQLYEAAATAAGHKIVEAPHEQEIRIAGDKAPPKHPSLGPLQDLPKLVEAFISARSGDAMKKAADRLLEFLAEADVSPQLLNRLELPHFSFPSVLNSREVMRFKDGVETVSWNDHFEVAKKSRNVARALWALGVEDPRLYALFDSRDLPDLLVGRYAQIDRHYRSLEAPLGHFEISAEGKLTRGLIKKSFVADESEAAVAVLDRRERAWAFDLEELFTRALKRADPKAIETIARARRLKTLDPKNPSPWIGADILTEDNLELFLDYNYVRLRDLRDDGGAEDNQAEFVRALGKLFRKKNPKVRERIRKFFLTEFESQRSRPTVAAPYSQFILNDPHELFTPAERNHLADILVDILPAHEEGALFKADLAFAPKFYGYSPPTDRRGLVEAIQKIGANEGPFAKKVAAAVLAKYLTQAGNEPLHLADLDILLPYTNVDELMRSNRFRSWLEGDYLARAQWPTDTLKFAEIWKLWDRHGLFPKDRRQSKEVLKSLLETARGEKRPARKIQIFETLLGGTRIDDPALRQETQEAWADAVAEHEGKDTGDAKYSARIQRRLKNFSDHLGMSDRAEMFDSLAQRLEAQPALSDQIRATVGLRSRRQWEDTNRQGVLTEAAAQVIRHDDVLRNATLKLILSSGGPAAISAFLSNVASVEAGTKESWHERERIRQLPLLDSQVTRVEKEAAARGLYENFWSLPFAARVLATDGLLMPPPGAREQSDFGRTVTAVLDTLFPPAAEHSAQARHLITEYLEVLPPSARTPFLAAMLVANERARKGDPNKKAGERLALLLEQMGPAETKLGQALHSYPATPDDLKAGGERLKKAADPRPRWEVLELAKKRIPEALKNRIKHYGQVLGSASYYINIEVELEDGSKAVLGLLRDNAKARAETGFDRMLALARRLGADDPVQRHFVELIEHARRNAEIETDSDVYAQQSKIAEELYRKYSILVNGNEFTFDTAKALETGPGYRLLTKAEGAHFNDLPETTEAERKFKAELATAYVSLELMQILRGRQFDHDRHGAQMKTHGQHTRLFDFGGMATDLPSTEEKIFLGEVLYDILKSSQDWKKMANLLVDRARSLPADKKHISEYLIKTQKALLALGDYLKYVDPGHLAAIFGAIHEHGKIDPAIQQGFLGKMLGDTSPASPTRALCSLVSIRISEN